jgi:hypothetical protein
MGAGPGRLGLVVTALAVAACGSSLVEMRDCEPGGATRPLCGLANPEDVVVLPGGRWLIASELRKPGAPPTRLVAFTLDADAAVPLVGPGMPAARDEDPIFASNAKVCPGPLAPGELEPHGLDLVVEEHPPWLLLVVNHGRRESVEAFTVTPTDGAPRLGWAGCFPLPAGKAANDVVALADGGIAVSASAPTVTRWEQTVGFVKLMLGIPMGEALEWEADTGWRTVAGTAAVVPNGVAASADQRWLWLADWGRSRLIRIDRSGAAAPRVLDLPHHPDNLSLAPDGRFLVAGHVGSIFTALRCLLDSAMSRCGAPFSVVAVDPERFTATTVYTQDGRDMGAASSATLAGGTLVIGTWSGDRLTRVAMP